jgi:hypothetical protein
MKTLKWRLKEGEKSERKKDEIEKDEEKRWNLERQNWRT